MRSNMIGLVALDLILRIVGGGVMRVALIFEIADVNLGDRSAYAARLGIPAHMIANFECSSHGALLPYPTFSRR
jgi:hypothetical protein